MHNQVKRISQLIKCTALCLLETVSLTLILLLGLIFWFPAARAQATTNSDKSIEKVTLQLKWHHQFQFAGYYAAVEKGYYSDDGLEVFLKEGSSGMSVTDEVVSGRAEFGIEMPSILLERLVKGKPIVVLAAILQHSPEIIIARKDSGIESPQDLIERSLELRPKGNIESRAMLINEGINFEDVRIVDHSWDINNLINKKVDASAGYITDRPFMLEKQGVPYTVIKPLTYGIDFYGDCLITSEMEIKDQPERVRAFYEASLRGWAYAMENPDEIIEIILTKYNPSLSKEFLRVEAQAMRQLMLPKFIGIGHMNPGRWQHIGDTFVKLGMLKPDYSLKGFMYDPNPKPDYKWIYWTIGIIGVVLIITGGCVVILFNFNRRLKKEVRVRTFELSETNQKLVNDITERRKAEEALLKEKEFTETALNAQQDTFFLLEPATERAIRWNQAFRDITGYTDEEISSMPAPASYYGPEDLKRAAIFIEKVLEKGIGKIELELLCKDGRKVPTEYSVAVIEDGADSPKYIISIGRDISGRKQAQKTLLDSEERLRKAQRIGKVGFIDWNLVTNKIEWSEETFKMYGFDPQNYKPTIEATVDLVPADERELVEQRLKMAIDNKAIYDIEHRVVRSDGKVINVEVNAEVTRDENDKPVRMLGVVRDITERKQTEDARQKLDKMDSIGTLAGGIAHDFNNLLTAILNNLYLIKMFSKSEGKIHDRIESAEKASMKAQSLTLQLLTFARGGAPIREVVDIKDVINESVSLSLRGSNVQYEPYCADDLWHVEVDEGQMNQVFNNIIINADQSMPDGGTIAVNCENVSLEAERDIPVEKGDYVKVSIMDQGTGMSEELLSKIFDPYFTTKEKGSGLGLTTAYSIVTRHGGHIEAESSVGNGATFHIYLPASKGKMPDKKLPKADLIRGEGKILIMDDDELVRDSLGQMVENLGYRSEYAIDGNEAVEVYRNAMASGQPFDVVIMDLTIPGGAGGKETIEKLKKVDPRVKAIVSSGYFHDPVLANYCDYGFKAVLHKPYKSIEELSIVLHDVIKGPY